MLALGEKYKESVWVWLQFDKYGVDLFVKFNAVCTYVGMMSGAR